MAGNKQAIKARLRSVKTTKKITKAMQMISNAKLARIRKEMETNRTYATTLHELVEGILRNEDKDVKSVFFTEHKSTKAFNVLFCSDLGLCGGYNANILKYARENLAKEDPLVVFGTHAYSQLKNEGFNIVNPLTSIDNLNETELYKEMDYGIELYCKDEVSKIQILYTKFINTVSFEPCIDVILPYEKSEFEKEESMKLVKEIIYDPSVEKVLDDLIIQMVHNVAYALTLETKTTEQASRRMAMENATDNAEELQESLTLQYNQIRQAGITQEITEIVSAADAV